ncbi:MAG: HNH endonuclease [Flavobacteriales bacterium]|nr:HNH endonuclease [Flavobacteriales bacterium]
MNDYSNELWTELQCEGFDSRKLYFISNYGRVKSYASHPEGKILKTHLIDGYEALTLRMLTKKSSMRYIHKLVAMNFIENNNPERTFVIHKDYNKLNNHIKNLAWASKSELEAHLKHNPNKRILYGHRHYSKLDETAVIRLKKRIFNPQRRTRLKLLAKEFGISEMQLYRIKRGENWASVGYNPLTGKG